MKNRNHIKHLLLAILSVFLIIASFQNATAQEVKKSKVRLKVQYITIMNGESYLDIKASSKVKKQNIKVSGIEIIVFNEFEDEQIELGKTTTNSKGESKFSIDDFNKIQSDSTNSYHLLISFKGNDSFKKAKKRISFKQAEILAKLKVKDSLNFIEAQLIETASGNPVEGESLTIQVQRLFGPLVLGEEFNETDEEGSISVPIEEGIPGIDGNLTLEVVLNDHDDFGTVKAIIEAPIGKLIVDESTFDQRTMWSPRNKTPIFLLIFPNLLIVGIWGLIIYLIFNLFKISKSKN